MGELNIENITSEDIEALIIGLLCNMSLKVFDNGMSIADNVLANLNLE